MAFVLNGIEINKPITQFLAFPYNGKTLHFEAQAVSDYSEFDKLCPVPTPPVITYAKTGEQKPNFKDPKFLKDSDEYSTRRQAWMVLKSLEPTESLKWGTVIPDEPATWANWEKDIISAGLPESIINMIWNLVFEVNLLSPHKLAEARNNFLASRVAATTETEEQ